MTGKEKSNTVTVNIFLIKRHLWGMLKPFTGARSFPPLISVKRSINIPIKRLPQLAVRCYLQWSRPNQLPPPTNHTRVNPANCITIYMASIMVSTPLMIANNIVSTYIVIASNIVALLWRCPAIFFLQFYIDGQQHSQRSFNDVHQSVTNTFIFLPNTNSEYYLVIRNQQIPNIKTIWY